MFLAGPTLFTEYALTCFLLIISIFLAPCLALNLQLSAGALLWPN